MGLGLGLVWGDNGGEVWWWPWQMMGGGGRWRQWNLVAHVSGRFG